MSEDGTGWLEVPDEQHDDAGTEAFHEEPPYEPAGPTDAGLYEPAVAEEVGHHLPDQPTDPGGHGGEQADETASQTLGLYHPAEPVHPTDEAVHPSDAGGLLDVYSPHPGEPEEPAVFEPGTTLFGWSGEELPGEVIPALAIEPGYLEAHYATGWALDPHGDGGILAAQATARPPGGGHDPVPDDLAHDPGGPRHDHGLHADVLYGGGGLAALAAEAWHETRPGEPWPADADGSPLSPHDVLQRLSEEATDPVAADVLRREVG
jgi:hypothetical protein